MRADILISWDYFCKLEEFVKQGIGIWAVNLNNVKTWKIINDYNIAKTHGIGKTNTKCIWNVFIIFLYLSVHRKYNVHRLKLRLHGNVRFRIKKIYNSQVELQLKPPSNQTAMPQRLYSVLKTRQRDVGSPWNTPKYIFASYSVHKTYSQRPHDVSTVSLKRSWLFYGYYIFWFVVLLSKCIANAYSKCRIFTASLQRASGAPTTRPLRSRRHQALPQRSHSALSAKLCKRRAPAFIFSMLKTNGASWRSKRLHSAHTARTQRCLWLHHY